MAQEVSLNKAPRVTRTIFVAVDEPDKRAKLAQIVATEMRLSDLDTLTRIIREQPDLIEMARGFLGK